MSGLTTNYELPYPEENDVINMAADIKTLAEKVDEIMLAIDQGVTEHATVIYEQDGAGFHNSLYIENNLTDKWYNDELYDVIADGTFTGIYPGSYIIGQTTGNKYLVADCDYYYGVGDTTCLTHHILMIPEGPITTDTYGMNTSNTTDGHYQGSNMRKSYLGNGSFNTSQVVPSILNDDGFTSSHVLQYRNFNTIEMTNGYPHVYSSSTTQWQDECVELMSEQMVYGSAVFRPGTFYYTGTDTTFPANYTVGKRQLAIFQHDQRKIPCQTNDFSNRYTYWLRDPISASHFAGVGSSGYADYSSASNSRYIRPAFCIY